MTGQVVYLYMLLSVYIKNLRWWCLTWIWKYTFTESFWKLINLCSLIKHTQSSRMQHHFSFYWIIMMIFLNLQTTNSACRVNFRQETVASCRHMHRCITAKEHAVVHVERQLDYSPLPWPELRSKTKCPFRFGQSQPISNLTKRVEKSIKTFRR
jgi:hypothetical protein